MKTMTREERRYRKPEVRAEGSSRFIAGYAARFNTQTDIGGMFREEIKPGAFARAIREKQDAKFLINHDPSLILARVGNGTLTLREDPERGLYFRADVSKTTHGDDALAMIRRADLAECSFGFGIPDGGETWSVITDGEGRKRNLRTITDCDLYDVSSVTYPAYSGTSVSADESFRARIGRMFPLGAPAAAPMELRSRITGMMAPGAGIPDAVSDEERYLRRLVQIKLEMLDQLF
jgi:HK97 family phage prohead protease